MGVLLNVCRYMVVYASPANGSSNMQLRLVPMSHISTKATPLISMAPGFPLGRWSAFRHTMFTETVTCIPSLWIPDQNSGQASWETLPRRRSHSGRFRAAGRCAWKCGMLYYFDCGFLAIRGYTFLLPRKPLVFAMAEMTTLLAAVDRE